MGQLYGVEFTEWLRIRDERDVYAATLRRIVASDRRTKRESLRRWAAKALYPDKPYPLEKGGTMTDQSDAERLREHLLKPGYGGTDYGLTDEELTAYAEAARARIHGRRWSWIILAGEAIQKDREKST